MRAATLRLLLALVAGVALLLPPGTSGPAYAAAAPAVGSVTPAQGPVAGGTRVTVKGSGFGTKAPVVLFGTVPGTKVTLRSGGLLLVTAPAATTAGAVCVRVRVGTRTSPVGKGCTFSYRPVPQVVTVSPASGPESGGQLVTIDGSGFFAPVAVTVGGRAATAVTLRSPTRITAKVPPGTAGTVPLRVSAAGGVSAEVGTSSYTYVAPGPVIPAIDRMVPGQGPAADGTLISLRGTGFLSATQVLVDGVPASDLRIESDTSLRARVPAGTPGTATIVVAGAEGTSQPVVFTRLPSPSAPAGPAIVGLSDRFGIPDTAHATDGDQPLVTNAVVDVRWAEAEPDPGAPLVLESVLDELATARERGVDVRLRIFAGSASPTWVKEAVGSMRWEENHTGTTAIYTVPKWWTGAYAEHHERFLTRLSSALAGESALREVTVSGCTTVYAEPLIRQGGSANVTTIKGSGYTYLDDLACLHRTIDATARIWPEQRISLAVNPFSGYLAPATDRRQLDALALMEYCRGTLGARCVVGNNSLRGVTETMMTCPDGSVIPSSGLDSNYDAIYCGLHRLGGPMYFQTARPAAIGDWRLALDRAAKYGAWNIELNVNYPTYDRATLTSFAAQLRANAGS